MKLEELITRCPNCLGKLEMSEDRSKMTCPFCDSIFLTDLEPEKPVELAKKEKKAPEAKEENTEEKTEEKKPEKKLAKKSEKKPTRNHSSNPAEIVKEICLNHKSSNLYLYTGKGLEQKSVAEKARRNFKIPDNEEIFLVFDSTVFGSCKNGFAFATKGIYYCSSWLGMSSGLGFIPWSDVPSTEVSAGDTGIDIGDLNFTAGTAVEEILGIFDAIKEELN